MASPVPEIYPVIDRRRAVSNALCKMSPRFPERLVKLLDIWVHDHWDRHQLEYTTRIASGSIHVAGLIGPGDIRMSVRRLNKGRPSPNVDKPWRYISADAFLGTSTTADQFRDLTQYACALHDFLAKRGLMVHTFDSRSYNPNVGQARVNIMLSIKGLATEGTVQVVLRRRNTKVQTSYK